MFATALVLTLLSGCASVRDQLIAAPAASGHACFLADTGEVRAAPRRYLCVFDMTESSPYWAQSTIQLRISEFAAGFAGARCEQTAAWAAEDKKKNHEHAEYLEVRELMCTFDGSP